MYSPATAHPHTPPPQPTRHLGTRAAGHRPPPRAPPASRSPIAPRATSHTSRKGCVTIQGVSLFPAPPRQDRGYPLPDPRRLALQRTRMEAGAHVDVRSSGLGGLGVRSGAGGGDAAGRVGRMQLGAVGDAAWGGEEGCVNLRGRRRGGEARGGEFRSTRGPVGRVAV
jgi:hypothetical protein